MKESKKAVGKKGNTTGENGESKQDNENGKENTIDQMAHKSQKTVTKCFRKYLSLPQLKDIKWKIIPKKKNPDELPLLSGSDAGSYDIQELITLEQNLNENRKEVELHKIQEKEVFVIKDSIIEVQKDLLVRTIQYIREQETEDRNLTQSSRKEPRQWKKKCMDCFEMSVTQQINSMPKFSPSVSSSSLSQTFTNLGLTLKKVLIYVVQNLKPHYPAEFDVCNIYARCYHKLLQSEIALIMEYELYIKDIYFLLSWIINSYPSDILKHPALEGCIDVDKLERLLPPDKMQRLEDNFLLYQVGLMEEWMNASLQLEVNHWKEGNEPEMIGSLYYSELYVDIIQIYNNGLKLAKNISQEIACRMTLLLPDVLLNILKRYKRSFEDYTKNNKKTPHFRALTIASINCCNSFRNFIKKASINLLLTEFEDEGFRILLQDLFQELNSHFRKIVKGGGLHSGQTVSDIKLIVERYMSSVTTLSPPCYQNMAGKIHMHLVKKYLSEFLSRKVSHRDPIQLQALAAQMYNSANLISHFCNAHNAKTTWLNNVIHKIADIISLTELDAIQLEVALLADEYPDIRRCHVRAILYIKKNLKRSDKLSIESVIDSDARRDQPNTPIFSLIRLFSPLSFLFR